MNSVLFGSRVHDNDRLSARVLTVMMPFLGTTDTGDDCDEDSSEKPEIIIFLLQLHYKDLRSACIHNRSQF